MKRVGALIGTSLIVLLGIGARQEGNRRGGQGELHYYVILSSDTTAQEAEEKAAATDAWVLHTNLYPYLTPDLFAVVHGPFTDTSDARNVLTFIRGAYPDAYIRNAGSPPDSGAVDIRSSVSLIEVLFGDRDLEITEHAGGSHGCEPQEPYVELTTREEANGSNRYWVVERTGEVRSTRHCELNRYQHYLSLLDVDDPYSVTRALAYFEWHFKPAGSRSLNDSALVEFKELYDHARRRYSDVIPDGSEKMLRRVETEAQASSDSLAVSIWRTLTDNGWKVRNWPVGRRIDEDPEYLASMFAERVSGPMRGFLRLRQRELEELGSQLDYSRDFRRALMRWETFLTENPDFIWRSEAAMYYRWRLTRLFAGRYRGPPLFDFRDGSSVMTPFYERFVEEYDGTETAKLVSAYLDVLRSGNMKCTQAVDRFLANINLADLNFGGRPLYPRESASARLFAENHGSCSAYAEVVSRPSPPPAGELERIPVNGRRIVIAEMRHHVGELTAADPLLGDSVHVQAWSIAGNRDGEVNIALTSVEFDASFIVFGPGLDAPVVAEQLPCGARLYSLRFPRDTIYRVIVTSKRPRQTGRFTLRARAAPGNIGCHVEAEYPELPVDDRGLVVGQKVRGELTTDDHLSTGGYRVQAWQIHGRRGTSATFDLSSYEFDAKIAVVGPGLGSVRTGGGSGGGCGSRVRVRFRENAPYHVIVTSRSRDRVTGTFFLEVSEHSPPEVPLGCRFLRSLLQPEPTGTLQLGREARGQLTPVDYDGDRGIQVWELEGMRGQQRTIDLRSERSDFALIVMGANVVLADEDGAGGCDDRITITFPEDDTYRVAVTNEARQSGTEPYTLVLSEGPGPVRDEPCWRRGQGLLDVALAELPTYDRLLTVGQETFGELTTRDHLRTEGRGGSYVQAWAIEGRRGVSVTIDLIPSERDYDPQLTVLGPGIDPPLTDFHGGGACNARLTVRFPQDGVYRVIVGSTGPLPTGKFVLRVTARPGPLAPGVCR